MTDKKINRSTPREAQALEAKEASETALKSARDFFGEQVKDPELLEIFDDLSFKLRDSAFKAGRLSVRPGDIRERDLLNRAHSDAEKVRDSLNHFTEELYERDHGTDFGVAYEAERLRNFAFIGRDYAADITDYIGEYLREKDEARRQEQNQI